MYSKEMTQHLLQNTIAGMCTSASSIPYKHSIQVKGLLVIIVDKTEYMILNVEKEVTDTNSDQSDKSTTPGSSNISSQDIGEIAVKIDEVPSILGKGGKSESTQRKKKRGNAVTVEIDGDESEIPDGPGVDPGLLSAECDVSPVSPLMSIETGVPVPDIPLSSVEERTEAPMPELKAEEGIGSPVTLKPEQTVEGVQNDITKAEEAPPPPIATLDSNHANQGGAPSNCQPGPGNQEPHGPDACNSPKAGTVDMSSAVMGTCPYRKTSTTSAVSRALTTERSDNIFTSYMSATLGSSNTSPTRASSGATVTTSSGLSTVVTDSSNASNGTSESSAINSTTKGQTSQGVKEPPPLATDDIQDGSKPPQLDICPDPSSQQFVKTVLQNARQMFANRVLPSSLQRTAKAAETQEDIIMIPDSPPPACHDRDAEGRLSEDYCAVCLTGGKLLCCDWCPRVYHLQCHVPALEGFPKDTETWRCNMCVDQKLIKLPSEETSKDQPGLSLRELKVCNRMLLELYCHRKSSVFHHPVPDTVEGYYDMIKQPMSFSLIRSKLSPDHPDHYGGLQAFLHDVELVFTNCATFNQASSEVGRMGKQVNTFFRKQLKKYLPWLSNAEHQDEIEHDDTEANSEHSFGSASEKRVERSIEVKYQAVMEVERGEKTKSDIAREYNLPPSTLWTWYKVREKIKARYEQQNATSSVSKAKRVKTFSCGECDKIFTSKRHLKVHQQSSHQHQIAIQPFRIGDGVPKSTKLTEQEMSHDGDELVLSKPSITTTLSGLKRKHEEPDLQGMKSLKIISIVPIDIDSPSRKLEKEIKPFLCPECPERFTQKKNMETHYKCFHTAGVSSDPTVQGGKIYRCRWCSRRFKRKETLAKHNQRSHAMKPAGAVTKKRVGRPPKIKPEQILPVTSQEAPHLKIKLSSVTKLDTDVGDQATGPPRHVCDQCGQSFINPISLDSHALLHSKASRTHCRFCGREFKAKDHLIHHEYIHTGEKPYRCNVCHCSFRQRGALKGHKCKSSHRSSLD